MLGMEIRQLGAVDELRGISGLFSDYLDFVCSDLSREFGIEVDGAAEYASTMAQLSELIPPRGRCFAAFDDRGDAFGMVLLRPCGAGAVEIKRLFVQPGHRGNGAGQGLIGKAIDAARQMKMRLIYLDSTRNLTAALSLYEAMGFEYVESYPGSDHANPDDILAPHMVFIALRLN